MTSTKHRNREQTSEDLICQRIDTRIGELTEPSSTHSYAWVLSEDKSRLIRQAHTIDHPSLLEQLVDAMAGSTAGASSASGYDSKPAANLEPIDALREMTLAAAKWARSAFRTQPRSLGQNLTLIASRAHELGPQHVRALDKDVLHWWARARIVTTWDSPPMKPHVRCDQCGEIGGIQLRLDPTAAACLRCGAAWDALTIGILGNHVQIMMAPPIPDPDMIAWTVAEQAAYDERCTCCEIYASDPHCPMCHPARAS